jgi:restriction endonuclease S subunit
MASGTVKRRRSISRRDFLSIEVELPSLTEQRRIARIVSTMQQSLATAKSVSSMKEKLHAATASSLFEPYFEGVWPVHPLGEITLKRQYGMSLKGNTAGRLPILRMTNLSDGVVTFEKLQYVDPSDDEIERYLLHPGDLLFNRTNSPELVGKIGILEQDVPSVFASYLIRLVCDTDRILPEFLNVFLNLPTVQLILRGMATRGVSQANISASTLATLNVPTPSLDSQKRIAYALSAIRLSRSASDAETKALATIYSTSQATLFAEVSS